MAKKAFDELMSIGIDIGKDTFYIVTFDPGRATGDAKTDQAIGAGCDV